MSFQLMVDSPLWAMVIEASFMRFSRTTGC